VVSQEPREAASLTKLAKEASAKAVEEKGAGFVAPEEVWATIIDMRDPRDPRIGSYQGDMPVYPASVVKLCYMVTAFDQIATGRLAYDEGLETDLYNMIVSSSNAATNAVLDRLANTGFGATLSGEAKDSFEHKRRVAARHMRQLGLEGLFPVNKTYDENVPFYGRDVAALGERAGDNYENSNMMTTNDTARLLYLISNGAVVSPEACDEMLEIMRRDEKKETTAFSKVVPEGGVLFSKSGSAGPCRHDAGIFVLPNGRSVIIVVFSKYRIPENAKSDGTPQVIERVAELVLEEMLKAEGELDNATRDRVPGSSNR
jgi:beta-lactamase class A